MEPAAGGHQLKKDERQYSKLKRMTGLFRRAKTIQHMPMQHGFDGHLGVVEFGVEPHPEAFHHRARFQVGDGGECHEFLQMELLESERNGRLRGLRGIAQTQYGLARRQPTSTQGENGSSWDGTCKPTKPMNRPDARSSTAQKPQPRSSISPITR